MSDAAEVLPGGGPDWEEVFAGLSTVTTQAPADLAGYYLDRVAAVEQAWATVPGLKGELRVGGAAFPADLVRWAAVAFDSMAIYPFGGVAQRVQWLTRQGFSNAIGEGSVAIALRGDEAKALLGSTRDPRIRVAVAMREDAATRSLLAEVGPLVAKARLWVRPRRVVLVQSAPPASETNWRLRDVDSASLEEVWSIPARGGGEKKALPIRLGPVSARETELFRVPVPFLSGVALTRLEEILEAERDQVARCRMSLDLAVAEVRREGYVTQRLLDGLVRSEWDKLTGILGAQRATLGVATLSLVAVRLPAGEAAVTLAGRPQPPPGTAGGETEDPGLAPLVDLGMRPEERVFHYLWRCWGMQRLARAGT